MADRNAPQIAPAAPVTIPSRISLPREWPFRLAGNLFLLGVIFMLASVIITIKTNLIGRKLTDLSTEFYNYSAGLGFKIDDIVITGRDKTAKQDILNALQLSRETNILNLDLRDLQQKVEQLPWVRHAVVKRRFFPNIIQIDIRERQVQSIWQLDHKFRPIDGEGNVIEADYTPDHPILLIVGEGAPENITALMKSITDDQNIFQRIKVANYISGRRWNIVLDDVENGITVKLPEKHIDEAWKKLLKLNTTQGLLKRKLTIIDLRFPNKVIVKLGKMTPEERKKLKDVKERRI
ncbi:cell division protein FtsQ [Azospirillum sp. CAG:260]|jgi:cell division protein ftsQ|uniref:cell division protein FtsQ/DivIB n=1 Tax=Candidatus Scatocola faecipullorum TaxID=2840917 RepID=UPI0003376351|nr:cell division protein FtsQ [Azospirillum sp. CAG:260]